MVKNVTSTEFFREFGTSEHCVMSKVKFSHRVL